MEAFLILFGSGLFSFVAGLLLLKRENRLFANPQYTTAKVIAYYDYQNSNNHRITMYTMAVSYTLRDGTLMHAREQSGSSRKKYPLGTELEILYSEEKPDMFIVQGDHSRKVILVGMIIVGILLMALAICV